MDDDDDDNDDDVENENDDDDGDDDDEDDDVDDADDADDDDDGDDGDVDDDDDVDVVVDDDDEDGNAEDDADFARACVVEMHINMSQEPLYTEIQEKCRTPEPQPTLCASPRSRNACQSFTRATLCRNLQVKCHRPE